MKQQPEHQEQQERQEQQSLVRARNAELVPRTFYRPDSSCSEYGSWFYSTAELGEVGPFDSREEAKEALEMSLYLDQCKNKKKKSGKKQVH